MCEQHILAGLVCECVQPGNGSHFARNEQTTSIGRTVAISHICSLPFGSFGPPFMPHSRIFRNVNLKFIIGHTKYARSRVPNGMHALLALLG